MSKKEIQPYKVKIRNNNTKEVRTAHMKLEWHEASLFWWQEGNMSCDCNRQMEFERAGGEAVDDDSQCGNDRYTVVDATFKDGTVTKIDGE